MIQPDNFDEPVLNSIWTIVNPKNDATISVGNGTLSISVPSAVNHDVWFTNDAPRVMQNINNTDFEIEVKFDTKVSMRYQMQGFIIEQDTTNYLRFDFLSNTTNIVNVYAANIINGVPQQLLYTPIGNPSVPIYMRIKRVGNQWTQTYSTDKITWNTGATFTLILNVTKIGIYAGNFGDMEIDAPQFTGIIDYILNVQPCVQPICSIEIIPV